jgi:hypothetical protein
LTKENDHGFALQLPDVAKSTIIHQNILAKCGYKPNMKVQNPFLFILTIYPTC